MSQPPEWEIHPSVLSGETSDVYFLRARPNDFTADLHEIDGKPVAKRGRIPGVTPNPNLKRII